MSPGRKARIWLVGPSVLFAWGAGALTFGLHSHARQAACTLAGIVLAAVVAWLMTRQKPTLQEVLGCAVTVLLVYAHPGFAQTLTPVPADKLTLSTAYLDSLKIGCLARERRRGITSARGEDYCQCVTHGLSLYVSQSEWDGMRRWQQEVRQQQVDTSHAQTVFLQDVAPNLVAVEQACRGSVRPSFDPG